MRRWFCFVVVLLSLSSGLFATEPAKSDAADDFSYSPNWPAPPDTSGMLLRLGFGTVATLGLCVATLVFGKRWLQRSESKTTSRKLQIEESVVLGNRATLFLVKVGDSHLVAGTDAGGLKSLIVLPTAFQEVLDQQVEAANSGVSPDSSVESPSIPIVAFAARAA